MARERDLNMSRLKLFSTTFVRRHAARAAFLILLAALGVGAGRVAEVTGQTQRPADGEVKVTTVFLVRHAEKADGQGQDPSLTEAGKLRAEALARLLQDAGVKGVYTSQFLRTRQTAEPLAKRLGLTASPVALSVKPSNPREITDESIRELTNKVEAHVGEAVLVVGHSNSIPEVIRMLGGDSVPKIDESKFDDLFVVTVYAKGRAKVVHLKYGSTD
jgi:broad specificity phosphatase PhoE